MFQFGPIRSEQHIHSTPTKGSKPVGVTGCAVSEPSRLLRLSGQPGKSTLRCETAKSNRRISPSTSLPQWAATNSASFALASCLSCEINACQSSTTAPERASAATAAAATTAAAAPAAAACVRNRVFAGSIPVYHSLKTVGSLAAMLTPPPIPAHFASCRTSAIFYFSRPMLKFRSPLSLFLNILYQVMPRPKVLLWSFYAQTAADPSPPTLAA